MGIKKIFFVALLITFFSAASLYADGQKNTASSIQRKENLNVTPVKFIDGIEIKRPAQTQAEPGNISNIIKLPAILNADPSIEKSVPLQFKYAQLLNRNVESITNIPLYAFIDDWWETHYQYGGTTKYGIDCSSFSAQLISNVFSTPIPRTAREQYSACEKKERDKLVEGDLVFFNTSGGVSHVGVYIGDGYFVHASIRNGVTINNLEDDYYSARFLGGGTILRIGDAVGKAAL